MSCHSDSWANLCASPSADHGGVTFQFPRLLNRLHGQRIEQRIIPSPRLSFFETFPPEICKNIFDYAFDESLYLRPAIPKPKEKLPLNQNLRRLGELLETWQPDDGSPPLMPSTKLTSLIVSKQ